MFLVHRQPPAPGPCPIVCDKGFAGKGIEASMTALGHRLLRPALTNEEPRPYPNWLRQRSEAVIWTLTNQLGREHHNAEDPVGRAVA
ncbi:MAG TPA: hypothetical protein VGF17_00780, partial [Phytomonospora sp.]